MPVDPLDKSLNRLVRNQLQELRIDIDSPVATAAPGVRGVTNRFDHWRRTRPRAVLLGIGALALLVVLGSIVLISRSVVQPQQRATADAAATSTSVTLDQMTVQVGAPAYRRFSMGQAVLNLQLNLDNTTQATATLRAGDILLVDARGAVFPVSWRDENGGHHDGLSEPQHTLMALDPGAHATIDLPYLVNGDGPFSVRYQRPGGATDATLPTVSLR